MRPLTPWFSNERKTALERYRHFAEEGFEQGEQEDLGSDKKALEALGPDQVNALQLLDNFKFSSCFLGLKGTFSVAKTGL